MLGSETGGLGELGNSGKDGMEVRGELNSTFLGWLQPTWKIMWEKPLLEMICHMGTWRKCVPKRTHPESSLSFGVGLVQLGVTCCPL